MSTPEPRWRPCAICGDPLVLPPYADEDDDTDTFCVPCYTLNLAQAMPPDRPRVSSLGRVAVLARRGARP